MTRIDEIRERLDKARPGLGEIDGGEDLQKRRGNPKGSYTWTLYGTYADAILLVNARNDLAWCLGEIERLSTKLAMVSLILDEEPDPCPEHPDDDPITCGWKRDIISIRRILNDTKEN